MEAFILSFVISVLIQFIFGSFAILRRTDKYTDLSYSVTFIVLAVTNLFIQNDITTKILVLNILVIIWGLRLGSYLFIRISRIKKDERFDEMRESPLRFLMFWIFQAISVPIIMLPVTLSSNAPIKDETIGSVQVIFIVLWTLGLLIESIADMQKYQFKNDPANKGLWIMNGLWKYSRHPNYFGELLMWWAVFVIAGIGLPIGQQIIMIFGPIYISILILFISGIPLLEKRYDERFMNDPKYLQYKRSTSILIPFPLKKA